MNLKQAYQTFEELDDLDLDEKGHERFLRRNPKKKLKHDAVFVHKQDDSHTSLNLTYKAARFEEVWLLDSLAGLYEHAWITDVLRKVKGGKEASVYLCRSGPAVETELAAAKVYRPRSLRNLKQDHIYREGRIDLDADGKKLHKDADVGAVAKRTAYGEQIRHQSWIVYEFVTLQTLYEAGADVPRPYEVSNNAILMDYIGDYAAPAPALSEISLGTSEARVLYERTLHNLELMLRHNCVHGDLSAYNILYWEGDITLIDFPQVVAPDSNRNAFQIFERDVIRTCEYSQKMGIRVDAQKLATDLWKGRGLSAAPEVDPRHLDAEDPKDRQLWQQVGRAL